MTTPATPPFRQDIPEGMREALRCTACNTIIFSINRHDFVQCNCEEAPIFIDGGAAYTRAGGDFQKMESLLIKTGPRPTRNKTDRLLH